MTEEKKPFKFPKQLIIVYFTVFVDSFGYSFIMPILPYYTEYLHGTAFELGILLSIYAFTQAISCLFMGAGSDKYGRKIFLILSLFSSWLGPLLQSFAPTMLLFILARGFTGLLSGSSTVGQAYIADVVPPEYHANYLSHMGAILSCAFVIGPAFGGLLAEISLHMPFWVAAACALIAFIISFWGITETNKDVVKRRSLNKEKKHLTKKTADEEGKRLEEINKEFEKMKAEDEEKKKKSKEKIHWKPVMILALILKFCNESTAMVFDSVYFVLYLYSICRFLLYIKDVYQSTTLNNSILICTTGIVSMFSPILFFPLLHDKFKISVAGISFICSVLMVIGNAMMAFVPLLWFAYISCTVVFLGRSIIYNLPSAQSPASHQGSAISMVMVVTQCAYVVMPLIGTYVYEHDQLQAVLMGLYFSILVFILSLILYFMPGGRTCEIPLALQNPSEETKDIENTDDINSKNSTIPNTSLSPDDIPTVVVSSLDTTLPTTINQDIQSNTVPIPSTSSTSLPSLLNP